MLNVTLYLDNFRGFRNQFIPLKDVNFLVGENSTGKTSLMNIIEYISNHDWQSKTFCLDIDPLRLGSFKDYSDLTYKDHLTIGIDYQLTEHSYNTPRFLVVKYFLFNESTVALKEMKMVIDNDFFHYCFDINESKRLAYIIKDFWQENKLEMDTFLSFSEPHLFQPEPTDQWSLPLNTPHSNQTDAFHASFLTHIITAINIDAHSIFSFLNDRRKYFFRDYESREWNRRLGYLFQLKSSIENEGISTHNNELYRQVKAFGVYSGLWDDIVIKNLGENKDYPALFEILLVNDDRQINISNVGTGLYHMFRLILEITSNWLHEHFSQNPFIPTFLLEHPEHHLHPRLQAKLGTYIYELFRLYGNAFFIETHSDYILDRFLIEQHRHKDAEKQISAQVLFFERNPDGTNKITPIGIDSEGRFETEPPETYRQFFIDEQLELLSF